MMKKIYIATLAMLFLATSCSKKQESKDIIIDDTIEVEEKKETQEMDNTSFEEEITWLGNPYFISIERTSNKELPLAKDESGNKYYDNKISIKVNRKDGSTFFSHTFTKNEFSQILNEHTKSDGALLGLMFSKVDGDNLLFEGSVGSPDALSDDFIPFTITLTRMGNISIARSTMIDTSAEEEMDV